jgi:peptidoglycan/xylan/chitin deacetylase (PgdA/CDA1 family)
MPPFRLDRFLSLNVARTVVRRGGSAQRSRIPILMYHSVSREEESGVLPYYRINTSPERFREHMDCLRRGDFSVIRLQDIERVREAGMRETRRLAVLTFDDGYRDFYTSAFPILYQYGFPATVFLSTGYIGNRFRGKECMSWEEVRELARNGILFGSHTVTHPVLSNMRWDEVDFEVRRSRETIEEELGTPVASFGYPSAFPENRKEFVEELGRVLRRNGYRHGVTTIIGTTRERDNALFLKRLPINSLDDPQLFRAKLDGAYDWLRYPQYLYKMLRHGISET